MRALRTSSLALLLAVVAHHLAFGHGAVWRPPGADVTNPGGAGAPTTGGRAGAATAGGRGGSGSLDRWEAWWYFQREEYLPRHAAGRIQAQAAETRRIGDDRVGVPAPPPESPLLPEVSRALVLPVLVAALRDGSTEVVDAAAIALGRSVETRFAGPFVGPLEKTLQHRQRTPQQAAVLGLGILGGDEAAAILREILEDQPAARLRCGATGPLDDLLRGLAALALGLTDRRENVPLLAQIAHAAVTPRDVAAAAVLGLGAHTNCAPFAAVELVRLLEDGALDRDVRAQVPIALQRLPGTRALLPRLMELLGTKQTPNEVARSLVIALGNLALPEEVEVIDALVQAAKTHSDSPTRHFAALALGRLFERCDVADDEARATRGRVQTFLLQQLNNPESRSMRPFAALALGLIGRGDLQHAREGKASAATLVATRRLEEAFDLEMDPSLLGALAVSLGLCSSTTAGATLNARLEVESNPVMQSHLSLALALLGERAAIPTLRRLLAERSLPPGLRIDVARALGMLGDHAFEQQLLALLTKADDIPHAAAYAKAIGLLGGRQSVDTLLELAQNQALPEFRRAFAVVALGLLAEKTEQPWNVVYLIDANFTTPVRPLQEVFDIL